MVDCSLRSDEVRMLLSGDVTERLPLLDVELNSFGSGMRLTLS
jgi:hypothetical protein